MYYRNIGREENQWAMIGCRNIDENVNEERVKRERLNKGWR